MSNGFKVSKGGNMNGQEKTDIAKIISRYRGALWNDQSCVFELDGIDLEEYLWDFAMEIIEYTTHNGMLESMNVIAGAIMALSKDFNSLIDTGYTSNPALRTMEG